MAVYTVDYVGQCSGGEHITWDVYRDGTKIARKVFTKTQLLTTDIAWEDVLVFLMREAVKAAGATTPLQAKTAIEAKEWVL